jgi:hypothetical protein
MPLGAPCIVSVVIRSLMWFLEAVSGEVGVGS